MRLLITVMLVKVDSADNADDGGTDVDNDAVMSVFIVLIVNGDDDDIIGRLWIFAVKAVLFIASGLDDDDDIESHIE